MKHPYEYMIILKYLTPYAISGLPNYAEEQSQQALNIKLSEFVGELPKMITAWPDNDGWEVNSLSLTLAGSTLILSILLQRRRT